MEEDQEDPTRRPEQPGPNEMRNPLVRHEIQRASVWIGLAVGVILLWYLAQPILLILAGIVVAAMFDGGVRLLGRVLPIPRGWRLAIVVLAVVGFLVWTVMLAGSQLADQAGQLQSTFTKQFGVAADWAQQRGLAPRNLNFEAVGSQLMGSLGRITAAVGTLVGGISAVIIIFVLGIFFAIEPRLYEHGAAWMLPMQQREHFYGTMQRMGRTLRRLMFGRLIGMAVEGFGTWLLLWAGGVPMAALLGLLTGLLAFIPNIGAIVSGVLIIVVGFSAGTETGIWAIGVYLAVQIIDGYVIVPMVAKRTVDLAPALVLGAQVLFGALFGIMGLALADPIVAMIKIALERNAKLGAKQERTRKVERQMRKRADPDSPDPGPPLPG